METDRLPQPHEPDSIAHERRWTTPIPLTLLVAVVIGGGFAAYQRIGTLANVDVVETTRNLPGGFMAVGRTEHQPGFLLVSALEEKDVTINAERYTHVLAGTHTRLCIETSTHRWNERLRSPVVITVDGEGRIVAGTVGWSLHTFQMLNDAADCQHASPGIKKHCGAPFLDIHAHIAKWPPDAVPAHLRTFLTNH